jgi:replicative DNA helicase
MSVRELLAFSENQQQAVIGHCLQHPAIWDILQEFNVNDKWLSSGALSDVYNKLAAFKAEYSRLPLSIDEIVDYVSDELLKGAIKRTLAKCVESRKKHPWDTLEKKIVGWAKSRLIFTATKEIAQKYDEGKHEEAMVLVQKSAVELQRIESVAGLEPDGFVSAAERIKDEAMGREEDEKRTIKYSIPYLQDVTGGILPTEVVLWGATSGAGKTEAGKIQVAYSARTLQEPVHYFALEAEPLEIERRIKYGMMGRRYREAHAGIPQGLISYKNWRQNRLNTEFAPYEKEVEAEFSKDYKTLNTYYRKRGDFGIAQLERELWKLKGQSRLAVIDHIHFLDLDGTNEVKELSDLIKKIRQMSAVLGFPIIMIAHITEKGVKHNELIPRKEDFYSASNLFKTSTTAIMMAPCRGLVSSDSRSFGIPTFMRVVKGRIDNAMQHFPGISFFNTYTSDYSDFYSVGKLDKGNKKWVALKGDLPSWVDIEHNICDVSDIE